MCGTLLTPDVGATARRRAAWPRRRRLACPPRAGGRLAVRARQRAGIIRLGGCAWLALAIWLGVVLLAWLCVVAPGAHIQPDACARCQVLLHLWLFVWLAAGARAYESRARAAARGATPVVVCHSLVVPSLFDYETTTRHVYRSTV